MDTVAILGAGAWGTALAVHLAQTASAPSIRLWARDPDQARVLTMTRENARYLPGVALDSAVTVSADLQEILAGASLLLVATPIGALIDVVTAAR
ncbi:MAG: glycerol-3-phosphate dehydrogenase, partial [Betaproteobacteria bacterium]